MAGPQTDTTGRIVPQTKNGNGGDNTLIALLGKMAPEIQRALPRHMDADRMARIALTALRTTRDLAICTRESFAACIMQAAQLGLEPNTPLGHLYLIPRKNKRLPSHQRECTLIIGYQGQIELSRRSGLVSSVYAYAVREGDAFQYQLGLHPDIKHIPSDDPKREERLISHAYAVSAMRDSDERVFQVLTSAQINQRRRRSAASDEGPWVTDFEAMCLKTAVRALWKWLPKSAEIARAEALDTAAELGRSQASVFDPVVTDALQRQGLLVEDTGEVIDEETGEVVGETTAPAVNTSANTSAPETEPLKVR